MSDAIRALSIRLEDETGYDSIPTIERVYLTNDSGTYMCPWPECRYTRDDSEAMWKHVHFGRKHPRSFDRSLDALLAAEGPDHG